MPSSRHILQDAASLGKSARFDSGTRSLEFDHERVMLSVVVCTWNRADVLRNTLASLAMMTNPQGMKWELLVVDNASTDHTADVIGSFAGSLSLPRESGHLNSPVDTFRVEVADETSGQGQATSRAQRIQSRGPVSSAVHGGVEVGGGPTRRAGRSAASRGRAAVGRRARHAV